MFGISFIELIIILVVALIVIPPRHLPEVARFLGRAVRAVRELMWRITDMTESVQDQITREVPINQIVNQTTEQALDAFSTRREKRKTKDEKRETRNERR